MRGFVYKLYSTEGPEYYIGSTELPLEKRLKYHIELFNSLEDNQLAYSKILFKKYDIENIKIQLLEEVEVESKKELRKKEEEYLECNRANKNCVNKNRAYRNPDLKKMYKKEDNARFYKATALSRKIQYRNLKYLSVLPYYRVKIN